MQWLNIERDLKQFGLGFCFYAVEGMRFQVSTIVIVITLLRNYWRSGVDWLLASVPTAWKYIACLKMVPECKKDWDWDSEIVSYKYVQKWGKCKRQMLQNWECTSFCKKSAKMSMSKADKTHCKRKLNWQLNAIFTSKHTCSTWAAEEKIKPRLSAVTDTWVEHTPMRCNLLAVPVAECSLNEWNFWLAVKSQSVS